MENYSIERVDENVATEQLDKVMASCLYKIGLNMDHQLITKVKERDLTEDNTDRETALKILQLILRAYEQRVDLDEELLKNNGGFLF